MDDELAAVVQQQYDDLEEPAPAVEAETQFTGWFVVVDRVGDDVGTGGGADVLVADLKPPPERKTK